MGSKTPEGRYDGHHGDSPGGDKPHGVGGEPRGSHSSRDGDGCLGDLGGRGDDDSDGDGRGGQVARPGQAAAPSIDAATPSKKRNKPKKKKKATKKAHPPSVQSSPPRIPLTDLFPSGQYPIGEVQPYGGGIDLPPRTRRDELRHDARRQYWEDEGFLQDYRKAAEVHRQARKWVWETAKPGQTVHDVASGIEDSVRALLANAGVAPGDGRKSGMGFPTGICLNHQVAHYTPQPGQKEVVLQPQDVMTVDFGVHINGWIVDSAFTMAFDPTYDNLLAAVRDSTNTGIKAAGVDVRISDVSAAIQEAMESYEVDIRGRTFPVKPIRNLSGHNIKQHRIHGGKSIPFVKHADQTKMEEGEVFALETFGSTGRGYVDDDVGTYGYGLHHDAPLTVPVPLATARRLHRTIRENFGTLVFCRRYLDRLGLERYLAGMNCLVAQGVVEQYRPLADVKGSYSAQFEHTFLLRETHKEVLSRGDDY